MKRSQINTVYRQACACFERTGWALPPEPRWDITDFGLGHFDEYGLTLINLAEEPEYCEKLMYARKGQKTPAHTHQQKKEDIICRNGQLALLLWPGDPRECAVDQAFPVQVNGKPQEVTAGQKLVLQSGERITLTPGIYHEFYPESDECVIGEVSTANDDQHDNFFVDENIGRFPGIEEDAPAEVRLISEVSD